MRRWFGCVLVWICLATSAAQGGEAAATWWDGKVATGEWLGVRPTLEERGIRIGGFWKGYTYLVTGGGLTGGKARGAFDEEIKITVSLDLGKLAGLRGLRLDGDVRYRDGRDVNNYVGATPGFNPSPIQSGKGWRMGQAYATWQSGDLLPVPDMITLSGGWQNPYQFFGVQPLSKFFTNNVIVANKGIGMAGIPWSSSYAAWGGYLRVKPVEWAYVQGGLYLAVPGATASANHGLYFQGASPASANGLFFIAETGVTPKLGPDQLEGKYAAGFIYYGVENQGFDEQIYDERWDVYLQMDQRLTRESSGDAQGLSWIGWVNLSADATSAVPFYFHTGLVYEGLIPGRDRDQAGVAFAFGSFSDSRIRSRQAAGLADQDTWEAVVEADYRFAVNRFVSIKPFWQYLMRPNADGNTPNANILGVECQVTF